MDFMIGDDGCPRTGGASSHDTAALHVDDLTGAEADAAADLVEHSQHCVQCMAWTSCAEGTRLLNAFLATRRARLTVRARRPRPGGSG
jgi:hypothetical protein